MPGVALYTKVGTLQKGGKELDILRCGRGSSSLESFHRHQCAFIPGTFASRHRLLLYVFFKCYFLLCVGIIQNNTITTVGYSLYNCIYVYVLYISIHFTIMVNNIEPKKTEYFVS